LLDFVNELWFQDTRWARTYSSCGTARSWPSHSPTRLRPRDENRTGNKEWTKRLRSTSQQIGSNRGTPTIWTEYCRTMLR
jgi:hypothetical protein